MNCADKKVQKCSKGKERLAACPGKPNCVSSLATDGRHAIEPLNYENMERQKAYDTLLSILSTLPRMDIVSREEDYIHVTVKSRIFRFVDDVEFYFPDDASVIHVRSASRTGYSDLGVNRKRVEEIRERFNAALLSD